jgi:nitrogen fixation protein NifU and related proteins
MYSKKVIKNFTHPMNVGELKNPDGVGKVGNPVCGDVMEIHIKVENNKIKDIKFRTFGCASAIATSSMITQLAKGKTLNEARKITKANVAKQLDGLPKLKMHCSNLAEEALNAAIDNYQSKTKAKFKRTTCNGCKKKCKKRK